MDTISVPFLAGIASTAIFAGSTLPMVAQAFRTRDLSSYSLGNLVLINVGNAIYSLYVLALPLGPIWGLHVFYVTSSAAMLLGFLRFESGRSTPRIAVDQQPENTATLIQEPGNFTDVPPPMRNDDQVTTIVKPFQEEP